MGLSTIQKVLVALGLGAVATGAVMVAKAKPSTGGYFVAGYHFVVPAGCQAKPTDCQPKGGQVMVINGLHYLVIGPNPCPNGTCSYNFVLSTEEGGPIYY